MTRHISDPTGADIARALRVIGLGLVTLAVVLAVSFPIGLFLAGGGP